MYNPCNNISKEGIEYYSYQMEEPKLIIGDLNAHHPLWETKPNSKLTTEIGRSVFDFLNSKSEILLTPPGQTIRIDSKTGKNSTKDLIIASPNLSHLEINTGVYLNSDHLPIIKFNNNKDLIHKKEKKWHFTKEGGNISISNWTEKENNYRFKISFGNSKHAKRNGKKIFQFWQ